MRHLLDPAVTARPCKQGCTAHVHAEQLRSQIDQPEPEDVLPWGWTVQSRDMAAGTLYVCDGCKADVWDVDVPTHVCKDWT